MAPLSDDEFAVLKAELNRASGRALSGARRASGALRNAETEAWLAAGRNLAEKAIAALRAGDVERADRLVRRIVALPVVDESTRSGLMAIDVLLYGELIYPASADSDLIDMINLSMRLLPTLDEHAAASLLHALASVTDQELPEVVLRRIESVVPLDNKFDEPFEWVPEEELPEAVLSTLRLVLRLRAEVLR